MTESKAPTFAEVEAHLCACEAKEAAAPAAATGPGTEKFCRAYAKARPVIFTLLAIPFLPRNWKAAIQELVDAAELICPL